MNAYRKRAGIGATKTAMTVARTAADSVDDMTTAGSRQTKARYAGVLIGLGNTAVHAGRLTTFEKKKRSRQSAIEAHRSSVLVTVAIVSRRIDAEA